MVEIARGLGHPQAAISLTNEMLALCAANGR
jgi:hypothetical protein